MTTQSTRTPVAFAGTSRVAGYAVAPSSKASDAATQLDTRAREVMKAYSTLMPLVRDEPDVMAAIKKAPPYTPEGAPKTSGKPFSRWDWFCDYIGCKVTGGAGLYSLLPADPLRELATTLQHEIDAQKHLFEEYISLLTTAKETATNPEAFDAAIAGFQELQTATFKLRHTAADVAEGRIAASTQKSR